MRMERKKDTEEKEELKEWQKEGKKVAETSIQGTTTPNKEQ